MMPNIEVIYKILVCLIATIAFIKTSVSDLMVGVVLKRCEIDSYRNHSVTEDEDGVSHYNYINTTTMYTILYEAQELAMGGTDVVILNPGLKNSEDEEFIFRSGFNTSVGTSSLNIYVCNMCYISDSIEQTRVPGICSDFDTINQMATPIIYFLKWTTVVIIYDKTTVNLLSRLHTTLAEKALLVLSFNYDIIKQNNQIQAFMQDIYHKLYQTGINVTIICGNQCSQSILEQADRFDILPHNYRRTSMKQRSFWLLITNLSRDANLENCLEKLHNLDNVAILNVQPTELQIKTIMIEGRNFTIPWSDTVTTIRTLMWLTHTRCLQPVGGFTEHGNLKLTSEIFPNSHFGFNGQKLIVTTLVWPPFVDRVMENGTMNYFGFCIDLLKELAKSLNFTYTLVEPSDQSWGLALPNGSWTGMIGQLENRAVDLMMAPSSIQLSRERVMDYTYPYYFDTSNFLIRKPDPDSDKWRVYIDPFHWHVYVSIATALPVTASILFVIEKYNPYYHTNVEKPHSFLYLFWYMFGALLTQGGERPPVSQSARALISTWWIFSIVIVATYSGNLIAFLTVSKDKLPITTLEELGLQSKYKWGTIGGSYFITFFERSTLPSYRRIWNGLEQANKTDPDVMHSDPDVHIEKVRTEDYVYIGDKISMSARVSNDCSLVISTEEIPNMNYGVGLPNNSLFTETFSNKIMELMESGIFQIWMYKHWPPKTFCKGEITTEAKKIRIVDVQSAFYLTAIGIVIGSVVLISELCCSKCRFYSKNNKRQQKIKSQKTSI